MLATCWHYRSVPPCPYFIILFHPSSFFPSLEFRCVAQAGLEITTCLSSQVLKLKAYVSACSLTLSK